MQNIYLSDMAKGSRRIVLGFLFLLLLYALLLRLNLSSFHLWKQQLSHWSSISFESSHNDFQETSAFTKLQLRTLVRGISRHELNQNGITCISDPHSDLCITDNPVRITATTPSSISVHLTGGQTLPPSSPSPFTLHPYPRKSDPNAISRTSPVTLLPSPSPPPCSSLLPFPALLFSAGGFAGNFFHDINDLLIPLFLTSSPLRPHLHLLISDLQSYWSLKYRPFLRLLSPFAPLPPPSPPQVLCFPAAIIGLTYHGTLLCNSTQPPGSLSTADFRRFLRDSLPPPPTPPPRAAPLLLLISRNKRSRVVTNEEGLVRVARDAGFYVLVAKPEMTRKVEEFAALVNACGVLMGVHGAGLTNLVFLPPEAALVQIVPWGLEWAATEYFERPARRLGLRYVEYRVKVEESSLYEEYARDDPVIADPWAVNRRGYEVSRPVFTDGQNLTIDLVRFRETVLEARRLVWPD